MSTVYSMLCYDGQNTGSFFDQLSTEEKARYGVAGAYRCYSSIVAWRTARSVATGDTLTEVLEIADAFNDAISSSVAFTYAAFPAYKIEITTVVNGIRSSAFHGGSISSGYALTQSGGSYFVMLDLNRSNFIVDGIRIVATGTSTGALQSRSRAFHEVKNCICRSVNEVAFKLQGTASKFFNNIAYQSNNGFQFESYGMNYSIAYNNLAIKCTNRGFYANGSPLYGNYFNNVSFGNTTNWYSVPSNPNDGGMKRNAGASGDTPWGTETITTVTEAAFVDYTNNDFRLVSTSVLRDAGMEFNDGIPYDIIAKYRPNYTGGAGDYWDCGPFEYDSGNGLAPTQVSITITNLVANSSITIETLTGTVILSPLIVTGTSHIATHTYTGDLTVVLKVRNRRNGNWQPYEQTGVITSSGCNFYVSQVAAVV